MIDDCSRGIVNENINNTFDKIKSQFGCVVQSSEVSLLSFTLRILLIIDETNHVQVKAMVQGHDRRPALGMILARKCRNKN